MIKINLLGSEIEQNPSLVYFIAGWLGTLGVFFVSCILWKISLMNNLSDLEDTNNSLKSELIKLEEKTKQVNDLEQIKSDLKEKIEVINILKKNKLGPVKLLDELNEIIPKNVWLESIEEVGNSMKITGKSLDDQSLSSFMKSLENSNHFQNIDLTYSKQFFLEDVKIKDFEIKARFSYAADDETKTRSSHSARGEIKSNNKPKVKLHFKW